MNLLDPPTPFAIFEPIDVGGVVMTRLDFWLMFRVRRDDPGIRASGADLTTTLHRTFEG